MIHFYLFSVLLAVDLVAEHLAKFRARPAGDYRVDVFFPIEVRREDCVAELMRSRGKGCALDVKTV